MYSPHLKFLFVQNLKCFLACLKSSKFLLHIQKAPPDWEDFVGIMVLLVINSTISFIEENNAGNAAAALMAKLAPKTKVGFLFTFQLCSKDGWCGVLIRSIYKVLLFNVQIACFRFFAMVSGVNRMQQYLFREI